MRKHFTAKQQPRMTARRLQVLERLAHGYTIEEVAREIHVTEATVRTHVQNIYNELGALNRADAIRIAKEKHLV